MVLYSLNIFLTEFRHSSNFKLSSLELRHPTHTQNLPFEATLTKELQLHFNAVKQEIRTLRD